MSCLLCWLVAVALWSGGRFRLSAGSNSNESRINTVGASVRLSSSHGMGVLCLKNATKSFLLHKVVAREASILANYFNKDQLFLHSRPCRSLILLPWWPFAHRCLRKKVQKARCSSGPKALLVPDLFNFSLCLPIPQLAISRFTNFRAS